MKMKLRQKFFAITLLLCFLAAVPNAAYGAAAVPNAAGKSEVYTQATKPNADTSGDGSRENPYNRFEDAVANVADGGTIYILGSGAFINIREEAGVSPYVIDKNVTVRPAGNEQAELTVRAAGLVMGGDVTFENVTLGFVNKYHSGIFANGHSLTLKNTARESGCRLVHVFAGGLKHPRGSWLGAVPVSGGSITISGEKTHLGNIYAGGLNVGQDGDTAISIAGSKNITIGNVYACGAEEPNLDLDNMFDVTEPPDPRYDPAFSVNGKVAVRLDDASVRKVVGLGAAQGTSVEFSSEFPNTNLSLLGIRSLAVKSSTLKPSALTSENGSGFLEIAVDEGAVLNVAGNEEPIVTEKFSGGGTLVLGSSEKLTVARELTGTTAFETSGGYNGHSGLAQTGHIYIDGPETSAGSFTFAPSPSQAGCVIAGELSGGRKLWSINAGEAPVPYLTRLECLSPEKSAHRGDLNSGVSFDMIVQSDPAGFPTFYYELELNGKSQELKPDWDTASAESEELNLRVFMTPKLGSDDGYDLCIESIDLSGGIAPGLYEVTVSAPSKDGTLSAAARLTVLSDPGSGEGGSGGGNTGGTGGGSTGDPPLEQPDVPTPPDDTEMPPASQLFTDVKAGSWYEAPVSFAVHRGLFLGVGNNKFDPFGKTSRAMVITVIARMAGQTVSGYDQAVKWAVNAGVSDGSNIHDHITREQLATMLFRYAGSPGLNDGRAADLTPFADYGQVSPWAKSAMEWAVSTGIIQGSDTMRLMPHATATRAETAAIMERFVTLREQ